MSSEMMEHKLEELSKRVELLETKVAGKPVAKETWREAVGAMKDCDLFDEAARLGAEWRQQANAEGQ
jgi:hypothetical protein